MKLFTLFKQDFFDLDCIPPYNIDVDFDEYSDAGTADPTAPTDDVNEFTSCGKTISEKE